jgi:hypothetical protein
MSMGKKKFVNLSGMNMGKGFSLSIIHWVNYINLYKVQLFGVGYSVLQSKD